MEPINPVVVRLLRTARGLSQADLAAACGISGGTLSNLERGHSQPTAGVLADLAAALGTSVEALTGDAVTIAVTTTDTTNDEGSAGTPSLVRCQAIRSGRHDGA